MNTELQAKAKKLFLQSDLTKTEIAIALDVPRRTLHHWIHQYDWDLEKEALSLIPGQVIGNCLQIMLRLTDNLLSAERIDTPITPREADTLYKLTMTMSKLKKTSKAPDTAHSIDLDLEERLDAEDMKDWEAYQTEENHIQPSVADMRKASGFRSPSDHNTRNNDVRPTYEDFIAGLQKQEEHLKHLYPPISSAHIRVAA